MKYKITCSCGHEIIIDVYGETLKHEKKLLFYRDASTCLLTLCIIQFIVSLIKNSRAGTREFFLGLVKPMPHMVYFDFYRIMFSTYCQLIIRHPTYLGK